ncbi:MAG: DUF4430 domain-containing protein [Clostridiales bacterium]|nr:DUF4430 domain-containing protein [Clostridiales bacterium]
MKMKKIALIAAVIIFCSGLFLLSRGLQNRYVNTASTNTGDVGYLKGSNIQKQSPNGTKNTDTADVQKGNNNTEKSDAPDTQKEGTKKSGSSDADKTATDKSKSTDTKPAKELPYNFRVADTVSGKTLFSSRVEYSGQTAAQATINALKSGGIKYRAQITGQSTYFSMIAGLYEKKAGPSSGWCFYINGKKMSIGSGSYSMKKDDNLEWRYLKDGLQP